MGQGGSLPSTQLLLRSLGKRSLFVSHRIGARNTERSTWNCGRLSSERSAGLCRLLRASDQQQSAPAEIDVQEDYTSLGEAVPGLAGALSLSVS